MDFAACRYSTSADGTLFWRTVSDNGSGSPTVTDTTLAFATSTVYTFKITLGSSDVKFYPISGGTETLLSTHTTTLPTSTQNLGWEQKITTLTAAARFFDFSRVKVVTKEADRRLSRFCRGRDALRRLRAGQ